MLGSLREPLPERLHVDRGNVVAVVGGHFLGLSKQMLMLYFGGARLVNEHYGLLTDTVAGSMLRVPSTSQERLPNRLKLLPHKRLTRLRLRAQYVPVKKFCSPTERPPLSVGRKSLSPEGFWSLVTIEGTVSKTQTEQEQYEIVFELILEEENIVQTAIPSASTSPWTGSGMAHALFSVSLFLLKKRWLKVRVN